MTDSVVAVVSLSIVGCVALVVILRLLFPVEPEEKRIARKTREARIRLLVARMDAEDEMERAGKEGDRWEQW